MIDALMRERPSLHVDIGLPEGRRVAGRFDWSIGEDVLRWLGDAVRPDWATLETGSGYSTVVFAAAGCRHVAISPDRIEHDSIRRWCGAHDVRIDGVRTTRSS